MKSRFFIGLLAVQWSLAQSGSVQISTPPELETALAVKVALNNEIALEGRYQIQLFYGTYIEAQEKMETIATNQPEMIVKMVFEYPNYKIRTGKFQKRIEAEKYLKQIKKSFPNAFILSQRQD